MVAPRWQGTPIVLASVCGVLILVLGLQAVLVGEAPKPDPGASGDASDGAELIQPLDLGDGDSDAYAAITRQPLFFSDRSLPPIEDPAESRQAQAEAEAEAETAEIGELKARVAGIIVTPDTRIAMVEDNKSNETRIMREGMALGGEQAAWRLLAIDERKISFAAGDKTAERELEVYTKGLKAPAASVSRNRGAAQNSGSSDRGGNNNRSETAAEEVRRRIAERRARLREARQRAQQRKDNGQDDG